MPALWLITTWLPHNNCESLEEWGSRRRKTRGVLLSIINPFTIGGFIHPPTLPNPIAIHSASTVYSLGKLIGGNFSSTRVSEEGVEWVRGKDLNNIAHAELQLMLLPTGSFTTLPLGATGRCTLVAIRVQELAMGGRDKSSLLFHCPSSLQRQQLASSSSTLSLSIIDPLILLPSFSWRAFFLFFLDKQITRGSTLIIHHLIKYGFNCQKLLLLHLFWLSLS